MNPPNDEEVMRREYLLGRLNDQAREQVEERLLDDDDFVDKLSTTEDGLIDDYVFGTLSRNDRKSFEQNFVINDERRRKIQFAQSFDLYLDKLDGPLSLTPTEAPPWWETPLKAIRSYKFWVAVPALGLLLFFVAPRIYRWLVPHDQIAFIQTQRANIERQIAEFNKSNDESSPAQELVLDPSSTLRDSGGIKRVTLPPDIKTLTLKLAVSSSSEQDYRALVATVEGTELYGIDNLKQENVSGRTLVQLKLPTEFLDTGDYQVQLGGIGPDAQLTNPVRYYFGVIK